MMCRQDIRKQRDEKVPSAVAVGPPASHSPQTGAPGELFSRTGGSLGSGGFPLVLSGTSAVWEVLFPAGCGTFRST